MRLTNRMNDHLMGGLAVLWGFWMPLFCLSGCGSLRSEVSPQLFNASTPKVSVTCFLSPQDQVLTAKVEHERPIEGDQWSQVATEFVVSNAAVTLTNGKQSVKLRYDATQGIYMADASLLPITPGNTYQLMVKTPDSETVSGTCTVPQGVKVSSVSFDSLTALQEGISVRRYYVQAHWQAPAEQPAYYHVTGLFRSVPVCTTCVQGVGSSNPAVVSYLTVDAAEQALMTNQSGTDGNYVSAPVFLNSNLVLKSSVKQPGFSNRYASAQVVVNVLGTDQSYYQYQYAVIQQLKTKGNPFAEPVLIPNNIHNGVGCFAAYNRSTMTLRLK